jgi:hypothetical protein
MRERHSRSSTVKRVLVERSDDTEIIGSWGKVVSDIVEIKTIDPDVLTIEDGNLPF